MTQERSSTATLSRSQSGAVHSPVSLTEPIQLVTSDGRPLKAHIFAEVDGMSPAYLCSDEYGKQEWVSIYDVNVTDSKFVSIRKEALSQFNR